MFKRESGFTLIELIVVIAVLGILAAIIVPNISSFQNEARDVQLTADVRNLQTALDMYRADSDSGVEEGYLLANGSKSTSFVFADDAFSADDEDQAGAKVSKNFVLLDVDSLYPEFLRKTPKYLKNTEVAAGLIDPDGTGPSNPTYANIQAAIEGETDYAKGEAVVALLLNDDNASTAIVKFISDTTAANLEVVR